ncbi:MAG: hypothetical protein ABW208_18460 [Pyrinomonadaceae bacterium]
MTDEERQRTMDFILQQMAQFAASIQRSEEEREKRERTDRRRDVSIEQIRRILARSIWERRCDRRDWNERMAALVNAQMRSDEARSRLDEKMDALIDVQVRSEETQSRSEEWRTQMEESFARSNERLAYLEDLTARNSEAVGKLAVSNDRNSEAITKLTEVVTDIARRRNGDEESA